MLAEARNRARAAGITNVSWRQADAAATTLNGYDLLCSMFGLMFFGDPIAAFVHVHAAANGGARMSFVCWRPLAANPWMAVPLQAVRRHLPPWPAGDPNAPGMFAFADPERVAQILTDAGWSPPDYEKLDCDLDIADGNGLEEAVVQSTRIGAVNSGLRNQPPEIVDSAVESLRDALAPYTSGSHVRLPGAMWLVSSVAN